MVVRLNSRDFKEQELLISLTTNQKRQRDCKEWKSYDKSKVDEVEECIMSIV